MSHIVQKQLSEVLEPEIAEATAKELGLVCSQGVHTLYTGKTAKGLGIQLPKWRARVVVQADGALMVDTYGNQNGADAELEKFLAHYGANKAIALAKSKGIVTVKKQVGKKIQVMVALG